MRRIALHILILALMAVASCSLADDKAQPSVDIGIGANDVLPGNGSRAGYMLSHGNIISGSECVYIGPMHGARNRDYTIDYTSGTLFFTEPVRQMDSVRVDYRYSDKSTGERGVTGAGMLPFSFGKGAQLNMLYTCRAADSAKGPGMPDILTYGMNSNFNVGASSKITGMMYMAAPQMSKSVSNGATRIVSGQVDGAVKKDRLVVQNADVGLGNARFKLGFQDVGEDFAGFASMRDSKAAAADVINQLEKEKGIKRMDFAGEIPSGAAGKLAFSMGKIDDKAGKIDSRAFSYTGGRFKMNFAMRDVDKTFTRFGDLREADRAQLAAELGVKRTNYGLQFVTGMAGDKKPIWSGLNITQLDDDTGSLSYKAVDVDLDRIKVQADVRIMDDTFNHMTALTDEERARMALIARRQFDPDAPMAQVTAADKAQVNTEAGLDRSTYVVQVDGGPVNTWLSLSNVDSDKGGLSRRSINISGSRFSAYINHQSVDETFKRLVNLQPVELAHFGNEYGMTRAEMGGTLKIAGGDAAFSHKSVMDFQGVGIVRESMDFKSNKLKFRANMQDIDPRFTRILDLADADRELLAQERGYKKSDYWLNFQATRTLNFDVYSYDSSNPTVGQARDQNRYLINYAPTKERKITLFQDNYSYYSETGNLSSYARRKVTFDNKFAMLGGLTLKTLSDVNTHQEAEGLPVTTTVDQYHIESNQSASSSFTLDQLKIDYGDGRFEDNKGVGVKTKALENVAFVANYITTARESGKSDTSGQVGIEWAIKNDLALRLNVNTGKDGPDGKQRLRQFSLKGLLAKRFLMFDNINVNSGVNETELSGKQIGCDNALKIGAGLMGGRVVFDNSDKLNPTNGIYYHSRIMQYQSDKDPKKWYHLTFFKQKLTTTAGDLAEKRNYALDMRLAPGTNFTLTSYYGKDSQGGVILPVGGTVFKVSRKLANGITLIGDYTSDLNDVTNRRARVAGLGFHGTLSNKAAVELYYGWCLLDEGQGGLNKNVFRVKYDHKVDADHFISLTAERKSGIEIGSINPFEGDTVGRIDFRMTFD